MNTSSGELPESSGNLPEIILVWYCLVTHLTKGICSHDYCMHHIDYIVDNWKMAITEVNVAVCKIELT